MNKLNEINKEREQTIAYSTEILNMDEPPLLTSYLWLKIQKIAESIIERESQQNRHRKMLLDAEIYSGVLKRRRINIRKVLQLRKQIN